MIELRPVCICEACGHVWVLLAERPPAQCPQCRSRKWNRSQWTKEIRTEDW